MAKCESKHQASKKLLHRLLDFVVEETILSYKFIANDLYVLYFFLVSAIGALAGIKNLEIALQVHLKCIICGWLYIYVHTVANQDIGFKEDQINKPFRPYPQGLADQRYAKLRLGIIMFAYLGFSYVVDAKLPAIVWSILTIWYNYGSGHKTGFGKLVYLAIGSYSIYYTPWICLTGYFPDKSLLVAHQWFPLVEYVSIVSSILQDFRDVKGDAIVGRVTYPIMYGNKCRIFVVFLILITPLPSLVVFYGLLEGKVQILHLVYWLLFVVGNFYLAYRLMYKRDPASDSFTYTSYCFLCGIVFGAPALLVSW